MLMLLFFILFKNESFHLNFMPNIQQETDRTVEQLPQVLYTTQMGKQITSANIHYFVLLYSVYYFVFNQLFCSYR